MSIFDAYLKGNQAFQQERQLERQNKAATYLGQYLGKGDEAALASAYENDPMAAYEAQTMTADRAAKQQEQQAKAAETRSKTIVQAAQYLRQIPAERRAAAWPSLRQTVMQSDPELGAALSEQYDAAQFEPILDQIFTSNAGALPDDMFDAPKMPMSYQEYELAKSDPAYAASLEAKRRAGGTNVTVQNPGLSMSYDEEGRPVVNFGGGMTKPNVTKTEASIVAAQNQLRSLRTVGDSVADKYLTYQGRVEGALGGVQDKLGMDSNMANYNAERSAALQGVEQFFNQYRKEITGAAAAAQELEALKKAVINSDLGPREFKARYNALMAQIEGGLRADVQRLGGQVQDAPNTPMPTQRVQVGAPSAADLSDDALLEALNK